MATLRLLLNILNFCLGGFFTTLAWLLATLLSILLIFSWPFTRSCWEITKLSLCPFGNTVVPVEELDANSRHPLLAAGGTLLNILWLVLFGWWLCLSHIVIGIGQCLTIIGIPSGIAHFKLAAIALWPVGRRVVPVELAEQLRFKPNRYHSR
ncbi:YccF domain-containing protein [Martelella alba]|uniref:Inner membrane protein YccF n=1 Tax=Martelella alba TaxID=2590451 RepID=A0ABY2SQC9_9HYPH|nr:YccF domain-containing protein [Martelella alba]TKI07527.1 YccF domain-containing protein [Martelella alba]